VLRLCETDLDQYVQKTLHCDDIDSDDTLAAELKAFATTQRMTKVVEVIEESNEG
jgi:hypothetical protein